MARIIVPHNLRAGSATVSGSGFVGGAGTGALVASSPTLSGIGTTSGTTGVFFNPNIGALPDGNTLATIFTDINRNLGGTAVVQSSVLRPGGQSKCIDIAYVEDESEVDLNLYNDDFTPTASLYCRKWEMWETGWSNNWPVGFKTARYFTGNATPGNAYCSEKFIWQRYTDAGGSRDDPVWGLNHATQDNDRVKQYLTAARPTAGGWHKYETWMVLNTALNVADGILKCWIDDEVVLDENIAWFKTASPNVGDLWTSMWFGGNCSFSPENNGWPYPTGETLHRYLDSPYLSTTLDR